MKNNKKGYDVFLTMIVLGVVVIVLAYFLISMFYDKGYNKPKEVIEDVYSNIDQGISGVGGAASDLDQDGVDDKVDLCCNCAQKGPKFNNAPVATSGANIGCATGQTQTGANNCVNCAAGVA